MNYLRILHIYFKLMQTEKYFIALYISELLWSNFLKIFNNLEIP